MITNVVIKIKNFWSSESKQACLICRVVTKVNKVNEVKLLEQRKQTSLLDLSRRDKSQQS